MRASRTVALLAGASIVTAAFGFADLAGLFAGGEDHPAIGYSNWQTRDTVAELNLELRQGLADLKFESRKG